MRFEWQPNLETGGCALAALADDYDGYPTPGALTMDFTPRFSSPGRLAAASVLAFGPFIAGAVTFPESIAPELARGISAYLAPTTVFPSPLEFHPKAMPLGSGVFYVETPDTDPYEPDPSSDEAVSRLRMTSSGQGFGHQIAPDLTTVPTNAGLLEPRSGDPLARVMPHLAAAVLLAEDFGIGTMRLPGELRQYPRSAETAELLQASGLTLSFGP